MTGKVEEDYTAITLTVDGARWLETSPAGAARRGNAPRAPGGAAQAGADEWDPQETVHDILSH
jgi:hypothetical protein